MLKSIWSFLKGIFSGAELNNKNNITQINNIKKNNNSSINVPQINNENEENDEKRWNFARNKYFKK